MSRIIVLANGRGQTLVDDEDYEYLSSFRWRKIGTDKKRGYASTEIKGKFFYMHRLLLEAPDEMQVDHINGDGLDNRRSNLRLCTNAENAMNMHVTNGTSGFKGVSWSKERQKWEAYIKFHGRMIHLGRFNSPVDAARRYDLEARKYFGEFARLNFENSETA